VKRWAEKTFNAGINSPFANARQPYLLDGVVPPDSGVWLVLVS
jgi:hypothetical protein